MAAPLPVTPATPSAPLFHGVVKQVLSGDTIILRGQPRGGPPKERTVSLTNVTAPRLARRGNPNIEGSTETVDEPCAWEAREFLRKKIIGKEVCFKIEYKVPGSGREYGFVYAGKDAAAENLTESLIEEGLVEVRRSGIRANDESQAKLLQLEDTARAAGKGKWAADASKTVRNITWNLDNPRNFVDSHRTKPIDAIIEHVRDGCTVRAFLLPSFHHVTIMMSGIKCPMFKMENDSQVAEDYAEEAKFFTESRVLQRDVKVVLEGVSGVQNQFLLGTILHPMGNIQELMVREGFARCVDWSIGIVSEGPEKLRAAEKIAKTKKVRLWKDYTPSSKTLEIKDKTFTAKVTEIVNGDSLMVKLADSSVQKIFLASIRPPRLPQTDPDEKKDPKARIRPLYDVPYMFEAREFLRKKVLGKKVNVEVDYIQPPGQGFPEKTCCTVTYTGIDLGEALVSKGLATVVRYRQDDDQRSSHYDELLSAEARAQKKKAGMHNTREHPGLRVADVSGDVTKAKQFLPFLQRAGRMEGVVEFVASGSRLRVYIPRETCLITFLLSGISCPRGARILPNSSTEIPGEPYGVEAQLHTKELALQKEVEVEVEAMDKGGNFIGYMYVDGVNLSVGLVENGLSTVHFTAERGNYYGTLTTAEAKAKEAKLNIWSTFEEPKEVVAENEPTERKVNHITVIVTEVRDSGTFYSQNVETGPQLEKLMEDLRTEMASNPPLPGSLTPKKGALCAAKFDQDDQWYRAKIDKIEKSGKIHIIYIDYGNRQETDITKLATLPTAYSLLSAQATEYAMAYIKVPEDHDHLQEYIDALHHDILNQQLKLNVEYRQTNLDHVTLQYPDNNEDIGEMLVGEGLAMVDERREKRLAKMVSTYKKAQEKAKSSRANIWRYGDFQGDEATEFGYQPRT